MQGQEIVGDELAERRTNPVLIVRDNSGMWNWKSEWTSEQRYHREPVGAGANHAGFGKSPHIWEPWPIESRHGGENEYERHKCQQQGRECPHALELADLGVRTFQLYRCAHFGHTLFG